MRTPDEIKKGLECCHVGECDCDKCTYQKISSCMHWLKQDALAYIQQLETRLAQTERERDAAVRVVHGLCLHCKNEDSKDDTCRECMYYPYRFVYGTGDAYVDNWEWRGVCPENTKEE